MRKIFQFNVQCSTFNDAECRLPTAAVLSRVLGGEMKAANTTGPGRTTLARTPLPDRNTSDSRTSRTIRTIRTTGASYHNMRRFAGNDNRIVRLVLLVLLVLPGAKSAVGPLRARQRAAHACRGNGMSANARQRNRRRAEVLLPVNCCRGRAGDRARSSARRAWSRGSCRRGVRK